MSSTVHPADLRQGFGIEASRFTARLPATVSVIASEPEQAILALAAAADHRRRGVAFYASPIIDDQRALLAQMVSGRLLVQFSGVDERRAIFDSLAAEKLFIDGSPQTAVRLVSATHIRVLRDLVVMSDALLARSDVDAERLANVCDYRRRFYVVAPGIDREVPRIVSRERRTIVVWAPRLPAERLGVIAMAVSMFRHAVVYVCASGDLPGVNGAFVDERAGVDKLESAACIIDASIGDASSAIALTHLGVPLLAASSTGAPEFISGVFAYEPWNFRSIHTALARALGAQPPVLRKLALPVDELHDTLRLACPSVPEHGPLVSIVLPTYNRPVSLAKSLDYIAAQTYKNLDVIVVNDGGLDVTEVCAHFSFVRLVNLEMNGGASVASHAGMQYIKGEYFAFWGDDDWYFPEHFARVVYALETSGASVAHTQTLTRYYRDEPDGTQRTRAYKILHDRATDPIVILVGPVMTFGAMLFRRSVIDEIGYVDPTCGIVDVEYVVRASQKYDFLHVDAVTLQWNYNVQQKTLTHQTGESRFLADQKAIYAKFPTDLGFVKQGRADWLGMITNNFNSVLWPPDQYLPEDFNDE